MAALPWPANKRFPKGFEEWCRLRVESPQKILDFEQFRQSHAALSPGELNREFVEHVTRAGTQWDHVGISPNVSGHNFDLGFRNALPPVPYNNQRGDIGHLQVSSAAREL